MHSKILGLLLITSVCAFSQELRIAKSLDDAKATARNNQSFILVLITESSCSDCKKIDPLKRLKSKPLKEKFNDFVIYPITTINGEGAGVLTKHKLPLKLPAFVFLDSVENLIYHHSGFSESDSFYSNIHRQVIDRTPSTKNLKDYTQGYKDEKHNHFFLREYLDFLASKEIHIHDSIFIDYLESLDFEQKKSLETKVFVLTKGPVYKGLAYKKLENMPGGLSGVYKVLSPHERATMNTKIIKNTIQTAIAMQDTAMALRGAKFAESTWSENPRRGYLAYLSNMRTFYEGVKDTTKFLAHLKRIVEGFTLSSLYDSEGKIVNNKKASNELNNAAYIVYAWSTNNILLEEALKWSTLSISSSGESPEKLDTQAHLHYRLGNKVLAIEIQEKAIRMARKSNANVEHYEEELNKMKSDNL